MTLGTKRFDLARFGSENCCTFARRNAKAVYAIPKNYIKSAHLFAHMKSFL